MSAPPIATFGRRRGRPLRAGRRKLLEEALARLSVPPPEAGRTLDPAALFTFAPRELWLEIGCGAGEHPIAQAAVHPEIGLVACEPYVNGVAAIVAGVEAAGLANIRIWPGDGREIVAALPDAAIGRAFVLFPDPWPKARHRKRRLVADRFLDAMARILKPGAELRLATDDPGYLDWMLERLTARPDFAWTARRPGDWQVRPADWPATRYESKALAAGRRPAYLRFQRL